MTPIIISPPPEYIPTDAGPIAHAAWTLPGVTAATLPATLAELGFSAEDAARLKAVVKPDPLGNGIVLSPSDSFVRDMAPDVRARLYGRLVKSPENYFQQAAYRFYGTLDEWLGSDLSPETRAMVEPLIYRDGDFLVFADIELMRAALGKGPELQRLLKHLLRQATLLVTVQVRDPSQVDRLVEYWGRGGRKTDIRPLLESAAGSPSRAIDVVHLLPETPRRLLYRYPRLSAGDLQEGRLPNCFWTALNFFADEPDDTLMDYEAALKHLSEDYFVVQDSLQLGDVVVFSNSRNEIFHVATYVADGLVFTKNGYSSRVPWSILPLDRIRGHFPIYADDWRVTYYRRQDL